MGFRHGFPLMVVVLCKTQLDYSGVSCSMADGHATSSESTGADVTVRVVTLSGEHLDHCLPLVDATGRSSRVLDVRHACVEHFGLRARMGKLLLEEELLEDDQEIREVPQTWHLIFASEAPRSSALAAAQRAEELQQHQEAVLHLQTCQLPLSRGERECLIRNAKKVIQPLRQKLSPEDGSGAADEVESFSKSLLDFLGWPQHDSWSVEDSVCYNGFAGDLHRYLASMLGPDLSGEHVQKALHAYQTAMAPIQELSPLNPVRLGLCLNCAVFHHEVLGDQDTALAIARHAFDDAVGFNMGRGEDWELEDFDKAKVREVLQLLRDNLTLWTAGSAD
eukprot:s173_g13.t1